MKKTNTIDKSSKLDETIYAAEALYHALGYAMNSYIQNLKCEKDNVAWKWSEELEQFNVYNIINEMKEARDIIDAKYLKISKKRFSKYAITKSSKNKNDLSLKDKEDLLQLVNSIKIAASTSMKEFSESLTNYKINDNVNYTLLPNNIFNIITKTNLFFTTIIANSSNLYTSVFQEFIT